MKTKENCFLRYWPWLLPVGLIIAAVGLMLGHMEVLPDFWVGYLEGFGIFLAFVGAAFLITRIAAKRKQG